MADNILKGIIEIEAKGVGTSLNQVNAAVAKTETGFKKLAPASNQATLALSNLGRVAQDAPYGFIGIANNLNPLLESFQRLKATTGTTGGAFKALAGSLVGAGGIGIALSVVSSLLVVFGDKLFGTSKAANKAKESADEYSKSIKSIIQSVSQEAARVEGLLGLIKNEASTRRERIDAIKELQRIAPDYFGTLDAEKISIEKLTVAYQGYINQLKRSVEAKVIEQQLTDVIDERLTLERKLANADKEKVRFGNKIIEVQKFYVDGVNQIYDDQKKLIELKKLEVDLAKQLSYYIKPDSAIKPTLKKGDVEDVVAKAKRIFAEVKDVISLNLNIRADDSKGDQKKKAQAFLDDYFKGNYKIKLKATPVFDDAPEEVKDAGSTFGEYFYGEYKDYVERIGPASNSIDLLEAMNANKLRPDLEKLGKDLAESFNAAFSTGITESITSVFEGIGNIISGKDFGSGIIQAIGSLLSSLGAALIKYGIIKEGLDKILGAGGIAIPGGVAIALGAAAIAAGAIFKNLAGKRALGGPVGSGGSYLVGERGPELFTPNVNGSIIPNSRMGSYGGTSLAGQVQFVISGNNLIGVLSAAGRNQRRLV